MALLNEYLSVKIVESDSSLSVFQQLAPWALADGNCVRAIHDFPVLPNTEVVTEEWKITNVASS